MDYDFSELNKLIKNYNINEFMIESYDGINDDNLKIIASFDMCYYHDIEIIFSGVSYINCSTSFASAKFKTASEEECKYFNVHPDNNKIATCIVINEDFPPCTKFLILSKKIDIVDQLVYHYDREDVKEGERVSAEWVKMKNKTKN